VEFRTLSEMLCESCVQGLQHRYGEQHRADLCIRRARIAELRKLPFEEYRLTPEWRARRNRVLLRAGNKCELCYASMLIELHHRTYDRYGDELLNDLSGCVALAIGVITTSCRKLHRAVKATPTAIVGIHT